MSDTYTTIYQWFQYYWALDQIPHLNARPKASSIIPSKTSNVSFLVNQSYPLFSASHQSVWYITEFFPIFILVTVGFPSLTWQSILHSTHKFLSCCTLSDFSATTTLKCTVFALPDKSSTSRVFSALSILIVTGWLCFLDVLCYLLARYCVLYAALFGISTFC